MKERPSIIKRQLTRDDLFIIAANLLPVFGVWFLGWSATEVFIVYALETLIVGLITILKLLTVTFYKGKDLWYNQGSSTMASGFFFIFFFVMHFGIFFAVQTTIFSQVANLSPERSGLLHFFTHWYHYINNDIAWMLGAFAISYLARTYIPFLLKGEYKTTPMMLIMFQPYGRIFIQQFTVILGSMFLGFGLGKVFVLVFAAAKIFFETYIDFDKIINKSVEEMKKDESSGLPGAQ